MTSNPKLSAGDLVAGRYRIESVLGQGGAALQFEVELGSLDQLERVRQSGGDPGEDVASLMQAFSEILLAPPGVEILRVDEAAAS